MLEDAPEVLCSGARVVMVVEGEGPLAESLAVVATVTIDPCRKEAPRSILP